MNGPPTEAITAGATTEVITEGFKEAELTESPGEEDGSRESSNTRPQLTLIMSMMDRVYSIDQRTSSMRAAFMWESQSDFDDDAQFEISCQTNFNEMTNRVSINTVAFRIDNMQPEIIGLFSNFQYNCTITANTGEGEERIIGNNILITPPQISQPGTGMQSGADGIEIWIVVILVAALFLVMTVVWIFMCIVMYKRANKEKK